MADLLGKQFQDIKEELYRWGQKHPESPEVTKRLTAAINLLQSFLWVLLGESDASIQSNPYYQKHRAEVFGKEGEEQ